MSEIAIKNVWQHWRKYQISKGKDEIFEGNFEIDEWMSEIAIKRVHIFEEKCRKSNKRYISISNININIKSKYKSSKSIKELKSVRKSINLMAE